MPHLGLCRADRRMIEPSAPDAYQRIKRIFTKHQRLHVVRFRRILPGSLAVNDPGERIMRLRPYGVPVGALPFV